MQSSDVSNIVAVLVDDAAGAAGRDETTPPSAIVVNRYLVEKIIWASVENWTFTVMPDLWSIFCWVLWLEEEYCEKQ